MRRWLRLVPSDCPREKDWALEECEALSQVLVTSACHGPENCFLLASVSDQTWAQGQPTATPHLAEWRVLPTTRLVLLTAWLCGDKPPSVCLRC